MKKKQYPWSIKLLCSTIEQKGPRHKATTKYCEIWKQSTWINKEQLRCPNSNQVDWRSSSLPYKVFISNMQDRCMRFDQQRKTMNKPKNVIPYRWTAQKNETAPWYHFTYATPEEKTHAKYIKLIKNVTGVTWIWSTSIFRNSAHPFHQTRH